MPEASIATPDFLNHLQSMYPPTTPAVDSPWFLVAAVAFSASNRPEEVPLVFKHVVSLPEFQGHEAKLKATRKIRDGILKSGFTSGYSRAINALISLHEVMPEELRDKEMVRDKRTLEQYEVIGQKFFKEIYGETAERTQKLLDDIYPDLGYLSNTLAYGFAYSPGSQLNPAISALETSYTLAATLISMDTARQVGWHLDGARRRGATVEQVEAVRAISMEVAEACGITWKEGVPEVRKGEVK